MTKQLPTTDGSVVIQSSVGPYAMCGPVAAILKNGAWVDTADWTGTLWPQHWASGWTLVFEAPEPDPEPEWKPGTVAHVEAPTWSAPASYDGERWTALDDHNHWAFVVTDVHPLVVLDRDDVDVNAIVSVIEETVHPDDRSVYQTLRVALEELGLGERP